MARGTVRTLRRVRDAVAARRRPAPPAARGLTVLPDDVFLVSYPRSGNTWLRFMIANALRPEPPVTFADLGDVVLEIYDESDASLRRRARPRILKSHEPFDERYRRVIYLVRQPADVAVSYYHYLIRTRILAPGYDHGQFVDRFVHGGLDHFATWGDHAAGWLDARENDERFVLIRYEDMLAAPGDALAAVLGLLGVERSEAARATAVERSAADQLRRLERETGMALPTFRASRPEIPFIRTARAGTGAEELAPELVEQVMSAWPETVARLGYG